MYDTYNENISAEGILDFKSILRLKYLISAD